MIKTLLQLSLGIITLSNLSYSTEPYQKPQTLDQLIKDFAATTREDFRASPCPSPLRQPEEDDTCSVSLQVINQKESSIEQKNPNFKQKDLISFIVVQKGTGKSRLDERHLLSAEHLKTIDTLINLHLETLDRDLHAALRDQNNDSYANLINIQTLTKRHKNSIEAITESVPNSPEDYPLRDLIYSYYSSVLSDLIYLFCQPKTEDTKEIWEKKSNIFIVNLKTHLNQYETLSSVDAHASILVQSIQTILEPTLLNFFNESCKYIKHRYEHNRSTLTKGLKWFGVRESDTEKKFTQFVQDYLLHFAFLKGLPTTAPQNVQEHFLRIDNTFGENVSMLGNLLSWNRPPLSSDKRASVTKGKSSSSTWTPWW
ncbi:MAG: hypothetical protein K0M45_05570 [Candidatus Paracaedibacteraceae bacterium]|nr:hypothetical protein [Candidatus Paracaedibacteraceae bacterium]